MTSSKYVHKNVLISSRLFGNTRVCVLRLSVNLECALLEVSVRKTIKDLSATICCCCGCCLLSSDVSSYFVNCIIIVLSTSDVNKFYIKEVYLNFNIGLVIHFNIVKL